MDEYKRNELRIQVMDLLCSIMYASNDGNDNWIDEIEDLGKKLGQYDDVPYSAKDNRLVQAMKYLKKKHPKRFAKLEALNNDGPVPSPD